VLRIAPFRDLNAVVMRKPYLEGGSCLSLLVAAFVMAATTVFAEEKKDGAPPLMCGGCISPIFTEQGKGSITPYGRIELDVIYSNRNTNPLDPGQFNGYATAAGTSSNASSTFNPRYSVFGIRGDRKDGTHNLTGVVEADFYSQTDNAGNLSPRLRLAYMKYSPNNNRTSITAGMDWTPVMGTLPNLLDFSIMGYNGNLWQRLPQITVRHKFADNVEGLITVFRFERGLSAINPYTQRQPFNGRGAGAFGGACTGAPSNFTCSENAFNDPVKMPYFGTRFAYNGTGSNEGVMVALNAAYRYYRSAPTALTSPTFLPAGKDINSYLVGAEFVAPITSRLKFVGEIGYGQDLDVEFFRFAQGLNLATGKPVRTFVGWGELNYALNKDYTFVGGYGWDNPLNSDLKGAVASGIPADQQYLLNHRFYVTAVRHWWGDFYTGLEWNHLMTEWSNAAKHSGDNFMMSMWYNF